MGTTTLTQPQAPESSDLRLARRAIVSFAETHAVALTRNGNCHARDLVERWVRLTGEPMPIPVLRHELAVCMYGEPWDLHRQRLADDALAEALAWGDVKLVRLRRRERRR